MCGWEATAPGAETEDSHFSFLAIGGDLAGCFWRLELSFLLSMLGSVVDLNKGVFFSIGIGFWMALCARICLRSLRGMSYMKYRLQEGMNE